MRLLIEEVASSYLERRLISCCALQTCGAKGQGTIGSLHAGWEGSLKQESSHFSDTEVGIHRQMHLDHEYINSGCSNSSESSMSGNSKAAWYR